MYESDYHYHQAFCFLNRWYEEDKDNIYKFLPYLFISLRKCHGMNNQWLKMWITANKIIIIIIFFPGENGSLINNVIHNSQEPGEQFVSLLFMSLLWKIIF